MRERHQCPKCQGLELFVLDPWQQPDPQYSNTRVDVRVGSLPVPATGLKHFLGTGARVDVGGFELWVCAGCGYSELYAKRFAELAELARAGVEGVRRIGPPDSSGTYR